MKIAFFTHNYSLGTSWKSMNRNEILLEWNKANANNELDDVKELEILHPFLASKEFRLRGCLQAAKYDSSDLICYYLTYGGVNMNEKTATWAHGDTKSGSTCYVITIATVREILKSRNCEDVREDLLELMIKI